MELFWRSEERYAYPELESEGVLTYSSLLGAKKAAVLWILILLLTMLLSIAAGIFAGYGMAAFSCCVRCQLLFFLIRNHKRYLKALNTLLPCGQ